MFRFIVTCLAVVVIFRAAQTEAQAQERLQTQGQFTVFAPNDGVNAPVADTALSEDAGAIVQDFKEVCLSVYKAAVDNPYGRVSQQDVDWPAEYEKFTDRHSKHFGDMRADIDIDFAARISLPTKVTEWKINKLVTQTKYKNFQGVECAFTVTLNSEQTRTDLSYIINNQWHLLLAKKLDAEAIQYAMERNGRDCEYSRVREPRVSKTFITTHKMDLRFTFPHEALKETSELPECEARVGTRNTQYGGYRVDASGEVIGPQGQTIGRVNGNGEIIDHNGRVIGRLNKNR